MSGGDNRSPFWRARPKSTGAQVMLLQLQQTVASAPFQTLCGHFLSQQLKRTVVGGKAEDEEKKRAPFATLIIPMLCMSTKMGGEGGAARRD